MAVQQKRAPGKLIRDLFIVLIFGIFAALLVATATLYYLGPTGGYQVENILLSPKVLSDITYSDVNPLTGASIPYHFDQITFVYRTSPQENWERVLVDKEKYSAFYSLIESDQSLKVEQDYLKSLFDSGSASTLTLVLKQDANPTNPKEIPFQEVQILNNDNYYRIQIHDQEEMKHWAYFYHENIFAKVIKVFVE